MAIAMARPIPGMTPSTATPTLSSIDAPEPVREGGPRPRQQHLQVTLLLEFAVHADPRQRRQMIEMRLEEYAGSRRHGRLEAKLSGNAKLARAGGRRINHRISKMLRPLSQ